MDELYEYGEVKKTEPKNQEEYEVMMFQIYEDIWNESHSDSSD